MNNEIESPCTGMCQLDVRQICKGCSRTLEEIIAWPEAERVIRLRILRAIEERKARNLR